MNYFRPLISLPVIIILGVLALVLGTPMFLYLGAVQLYATILKLLCWASGHHVYDIYNALLIDDLSQVRCKQCQTLILGKDIAPLKAQKEALAEHIDRVAAHLRTSKETAEITTELSKLE